MSEVLIIRCDLCALLENIEPTKRKKKLNKKERNDGEMFINDIKISVGIVVGVMFIFDVFMSMCHVRACVCVYVIFIQNHF